jgi:glycosidase
MALSPNPVIYEINTWVWLDDLSRQYGRPVTLAAVPEEVWEEIASLGMDAVWLMGVWERSPRGARIARASQSLRRQYELALPDFSYDDVVGSPYSVHRYEVDARLGGGAGLRVARERLAAKGIGLILDFVPNHVATDHPWVSDHPEYFVQGNGQDLVAAPDGFFVSGGKIIACGRDPFFPPWTDTAQHNAFHPDLREAAAETVLKIAGRCDGVRCDMAMLVTCDIFERTWKSRAGARPDGEYWEQIIEPVRATYPQFLFIAEAYWDLEWELQQQGFDYCYDKRLYDRLVHGDGESLRLHLTAGRDYQKKLVRFLENHDEPRAASILGPERTRAAAVTASTLPGAKLFHEGQFDGRKTKLPVQLGRRAPEPKDGELRSFYERLLSMVRSDSLREGEWNLCETSGWPDNASHRNLVAWCWRRQGQGVLVVVNHSDRAAQGRVTMPWDELKGRAWMLEDLLNDDEYERDGDEIVDPGLFVDLKPFGYHAFRFSPAPT